MPDCSPLTKSKLKTLRNHKPSAPNHGKAKHFAEEIKSRFIALIECREAMNKPNEAATSHNEI